MIDIENRVWLDGLTQAQLRALACQRGVDDWNIQSPETLVNQLVQISNIQEPVGV